MMSNDVIVLLQLLGLGFIIGTLLLVGRSVQAWLGQWGAKRAILAYLVIAVIPFIVAGTINALLVLIGLANACVLQALHNSLNRKSKSL